MSLSRSLRDAARDRPGDHDDRTAEIVGAYLRSLDTGDIAARLALFAPDASLEDPVGTAPVVGHEALRAFWSQAAKLRVETRLEHLAVNGGEAAYLFTATVSASPADRARVRTIETIRLDEHGLIRAMRAHFDAGGID